MHNIPPFPITLRYSTSYLCVEFARYNRALSVHPDPYRSGIPVETVSSLIVEVRAEACAVYFQIVSPINLITMAASLSLTVKLLFIA